MDPLTIVIDSREKKPYDFENYPAVRGKLDKGDYSILGYEKRFAVERKSLPDWLHTTIHDKDRFTTEMIALTHYDRAYVVVETTWKEILEGNYERSEKIKPAVVYGLSIGIMMDYDIPVIFANDRPAAAAVVEGLCRAYARRVARAAQQVEVE